MTALKILRKALREYKDGLVHLEKMEHCSYWTKSVSTRRIKECKFLIEELEETINVVKYHKKNKKNEGI